MEAKSAVMARAGVSQPLATYAVDLRLRCDLTFRANCLNRCGKTALVTSSLVFVNDVFVGDGINRRYRSFEHGFRLYNITGGNGDPYFLDRGTKFRTLAHIVAPLLDGLTCAFSGLFGICHDFSRFLR